MEKTCLLLMLVGGTYALATVPKTKCDATSIIAPCSSVPGGTVYIKLMNNTTGYMLKLFKDLPGKEVLVFTVKKGQVKIQEQYRNRIEFFINTGTLKITDVEEDDAGQYILDVYAAKILVKTLRFTLQIKERRVYFRTSLTASGCVLLVIIVCIVIWIFKPSRKTAYVILN